jgi:hypothetical protein
MDSYFLLKIVVIQSLESGIQRVARGKGKVRDRVVVAVFRCITAAAVHLSLAFVCLSSSSFPVAALIMKLLLLTALASLLVSSNAQVTIYGQIPLGQARASTSTAADPATTTNAAYNDTVLAAPGPPNPAPSMQFTLDLPQFTDQVQGLSIEHNDGSFWGFSIEMSVVTQISMWPAPLCARILLISCC